jgi:FkbM family methyltransferase
VWKAHPINFAILIPTYNCATTVVEALSSLQQIESGWEHVDQVLLCDDCSSDNTVQVVQSARFDRCRLTILEHERNRGEAACYRSMLTKCTSDINWFLILHGDDIALPCFLTRNIEIIGRSGDDVAAVSSNYYVFGAGGERLAYSPAENRIVFRSNAAGEIHHTATVGCWWHISGSLVNRKLWQKFGGRSADLPQVGDWDLILRWQMAGYLVGHSLVPTTKCRVHASSVSSRSYREFRDLTERTNVISSHPGVFTSQVTKKWINQIAKDGTRRVVKLASKGKIADARRGLFVTVKCLIRLANHGGPQWIRGILALRYKAKMYARWQAEFGIRGLWRLLCASAAQSERQVFLQSKRFGEIVCRNCPEDFAAINTVMCFRAYAAPFGERRFESVLDLGANVGIATRYFLSQEPAARVLAVEPSLENCAVFRKNIEIAAAEDRVLLWECGIGSVERTGYLHSHMTGRFDSLWVGCNRSEQNSPGDRPIVIREMASAVHALSGPVLVKMDIEGSEDEVLTCRSNWIDRVNYMMVEFHDDRKEKLWVSTLSIEGWKCQKHFDTWHFEREPQTGVKV